MIKLFKKNSPKAASKKYYNFNLIARYFNNIIAYKTFYHTISDKTANDLDLDEVFERIDRTTSCIGQQYLYAKLRAISTQEELNKYDEFVDEFQKDPTLLNRCQKQLKKLSNDSGYYFEELFHGTHLKFKGLYLIYLLSGAFTLFLVLSFFNSVFALCLLPIFAINLVFHYKNKVNLSYYLTGVSELSKSIRIAKCLAKEDTLCHHFDDMSFLSEVSKIYRKTQYIGFEKQLNNDMLAAVFVVVEWIKIAFNVEIILFYSFIADIVRKKDSINKLFTFIGETDSAVYLY